MSCYQQVKAKKLLLELLVAGVHPQIIRGKLQLSLQGVTLDPVFLDKLRQCRNEVVSLIEKPYVHIFDLLEKSAADNPEAIAVASETESISYGVLLVKVRACAASLQQAGIFEGQRVALLAGGGVEQLLLSLALFGAGATVVPIDNDLPIRRIHAILEHSDPQFLVYDEHFEKLTAGWSGGSIQSPAMDDVEPCNEFRLSRTHSAYLLYTSGSNGVPKGVLVGHKALSLTIQSLVTELVLNKFTVMPAIASPGFDIIWLEWLGPLVAGGTVFIPEASARKNPDYLRSLLADAKVNCLQATPSLWKLIVYQQCNFPVEARLLSGGEALPADLAQQLIATGGHVYNLYGPTEATIWAMVYKVNAQVRNEELTIPLGNPLVHVNTEISSEKGGELLLSGDGLATGYFRDKALNYKYFRPHDNEEYCESASLFYCTGDLVSISGNGDMHFRGRADRQVKVNGFRIEPEEIEQALRLHPSIQDAVVSVSNDNANSSALIVAHVVTVKGSHNKTAQTLNVFLGRDLPQWMLPDRYLFHQTIPVNSNGKIDIPFLQQAVQDSLKPGSERSTQENAIENRVRQSMAGILGSRDFGRQESFFDLGGSSMLAASLLMKLNQVFELELPLSSVLASPPTQASLSSLVADALQAR